MILQEILEVNKEETEGSISRTLETVTTGTTVDTLSVLLSFVGSCSHINPIVKYGGYLQFN